jgi:magnesium chelatase accessory protein
MATGDALRWDSDGRDWPLRESSRFVGAAGLRWHVQDAGRGPVALLVHGTGSSTHSWRGLAPLLARRYRVVSMDLPGHGFTSALPRGRVSLPAMADAVSALVRTLEVDPALVVGNSAGSAILARAILDGTLRPAAMASINGALLPLPGVPGAVFSPLARVLAANTLTARIFAWRAGDPAAIRRLVASTGSHLDGVGLDLYGRLVRSVAHVEGTLQMMAGWDLAPLERDLPRLAVPLLLLTGTNDGTVPPAEAERVQRRLPAARIERLHGLGHLAHEERPEEVARRLLEFVADSGGS